MKGILLAAAIASGLVPGAKLGEIFGGQGPLVPSIVTSGPSGFLPNCQGQFVLNNYAPSANDFVPADGHWSSNQNASSLPVVTPISDTLPDGTTGTVSSAAFPAITTGTTKFSVLFYNDTHSFAQYPLVFGFWARVISGSTLFASMSFSTTFQNASISNDGTWHFIQVPWIGALNGSGVGPNITLEIGINQFDTGQRATTVATTVELTGAYFNGPANAGVISYADVKTGGPLATTSAPPLQAVLTKPCPAHVAQRDYTQWALYSGNPIMFGDPTKVWAGGGRGNPVIQPQFQSGGFYWAWNGQCYPSPPLGSLNYTGQCLYKSTDGLNWTEDTLNAPYLFLTGSNMFNPVPNAIGSGFTASASGTATWTGGGCATAPVIAVTTNASGQIATATPSPNNGLGTGSCPVNAQPTMTTWSYSGVGAGSGASFTWTQTVGTQATPGPSRWELHPNFLPNGCYDPTTGSHNFCIVYSAESADTKGHLFVAWSDTVDGVYTPLGCTSGPCGTTVPATVLNLPGAGYNSPGTPFVINVGGSAGINYIYAYAGGGGDRGSQYEILTTPADKTNTTSGNTFTLLQDAGFTLVTGVDWYQPTTGTTFLDMGIFLNHCGFYEMYFVVENATQPNPPWPSAGGNAQIMGEAVSNSPIGPWYQYPGPVRDLNSGDPAAIELAGQFILSSTYNDPLSHTGAGLALLGPQGTCP